MRLPVNTRSGLFMMLASALWLSFLFLPFKGLRAAGVLFCVLAVGIPLLRLLARTMGKVSLRGRKKAAFFPDEGIMLYLFLAALIPLPFLVRDYVTDVAILCGIYIILALGLNVVVGFAGLLNLGFVAFYAVGAYSYALLNTRLGLGFWSALPLSVLLTTT